MHYTMHSIVDGMELVVVGQQGMKATEERVVALDRIRCDALHARQVWAVKAAVDPAMPQAACMENLVLHIRHAHI